MNDQGLIAPLNGVSLSVIGNHKSLNEDAFKACPEIGLWVVADGMGGHEGGEIASKLAVELLITAVKEGVCLTSAIHQAHKEIRRVSATNSGKPGMGTTIVVAQVTGNDYEIAWVGDSRAYLFDHQQLTQLTRDHSLVQELIDKGELSEGQAKVHPHRNVVSQALGGNDDIRVDVVSGTLNDNILMLCSDGLSNELTDEKITAILAEPSCLQFKAEKTISSVLALKGIDNITVSLIQKS